MSEDDPGQSSAESAAIASAEAGQPSSAQPAATGSAPNLSPLPRWWHARRVMAVWGGVLAGLGFGIAIALLMHVIKQSSPIGVGFAIGKTTFGVLLAGLAFGLGLGIAFAALIPDQIGESPIADRATEAGQPGNEPASTGS